MSGPSDDHRDVRSATDLDFDAVLASGMTAGELDALDDLLAELRDEAVQPLPPGATAHHLVLLHAAAERPVRSPRARAAVALVACATLSVVTGGLAAAGALPAPLQDGVSGVAGVVGIDLPGASEHAPGRQPDDPARPGRSEHAPGRQPDDPSQPGRSEHAPGQQVREDAPGRAESPATAPGRDDTPDATAPGSAATNPQQGPSTPPSTGPRADTPANSAPGRVLEPNRTASAESSSSTPRGAPHDG